ncbi:MAG: ferredoxin [Solirubrobacterales bacterium]|nr:ferredoxin [Solirubrobacterales bacterium]
MKVQVDPIRCHAHGICAELLPERISLDDWGYPIVDQAPLDPELEAHAKRAAAACPTLALMLRAGQPPRSRRRIVPTPRTSSSNSS